jgi:hypothetical protein
VTALSGEIVRTDVLVTELRGEFPQLMLEERPLRKYYDRSRGIFFDCDANGLTECVVTLSERVDMYSFVAFFLVKTLGAGQSPVFKVIQVSFRNSLGENLSRFIDRFRRNLEPATKLSLQIAGYEYEKCLGFSYLTKEEIEELERGVSQVTQG